MENLYAQARVLRRVAHGVNDFFKDYFGKHSVQTWEGRFNQIVQAKIGAKDNSSNGTTSLYGTDSKSKICIEHLSDDSSSNGDLSDDILNNSANKPDAFDYIKEAESHLEATTTNSPNAMRSFSPTRL